MMFHDPPLAINEMYRVLKPNGNVIVTTNLTWRQVQRSERWRFTVFGLRNLFQDAGFFIVYIKPKIGLISAYYEEMTGNKSEEKWIKDLDEILPIGHITVARKP